MSHYSDTDAIIDDMIDEMDEAHGISAQSGNTNGGLKLNGGLDLHRRRMWRAMKEAALYRHLAAGGDPGDLVTAELLIEIEELRLAITKMEAELT